MPHPLEKPTSLNLLLSLTSSLPLLSENSILGRSFRTHAFLSCGGGAETLKGISLREFNYTLGVGFVGKMWEVSQRVYFLLVSCTHIADWSTGVELLLPLEW